MKVLIDIDEKLFNAVIEKTRGGYMGSDVWIAVANGKPYESEIDKIKSAISEVDFDFGDYYDHTDEIIAKILSKIDEVKKNEIR